jgi:hypothetical protein
MIKLACEEAELVTHIFFNCIVAPALWVHCAEITGYPIIFDFESLGRFWVGGGGKRYCAMNVFTSIILWIL